MNKPLHLTRRQLLQRTGLASAMVALPMPVWASSQPALKIPPLVDVGRGRPIRLDLRPAQIQFNTGKLVDVWGVNGQYLAPTVRVRSQDFVKLTYLNNLPQAISMNIQGLLTPSEMLGSSHRKLEPKASWSPIVSINQPACTCWYHADTLLNSAFQVYRGLAGLWIIEDAESKKTNLPNQYGVNDIPLILQDQQINKEGKQVIDPNQPQFFGSRLFVNRQESPYLKVQAGWIRLRIVNASLSRIYELRLDNGQPLQLIATGLGMFEKPIAQPMVMLSPSERVEVLVKVEEDTPVSLITGEPRSLLDKVKLLFSDGNELTDNVILTLQPQGLATVFTQMPETVPFKLEDFQMNIVNERKFNLRPLDYLINQQRFDPKRIDFSVKKGSVERWYLTSNSNIGFTLQGAKFVIETRNRQRLQNKYLAWKDTVWLPKDQEVTLLVKFEHEANNELPFAFGVSDLMLRDRGAMGQFTVET